MSIFIQSPHIIPLMAAIKNKMVTHNSDIYVCTTDTHIHTHTHTGRADLLTSFNILAHPRDNIRLFFQKCKGGRIVFYPYCKQFFNSIILLTKTKSKQNEEKRL